MSEEANVIDNKQGSKGRGRVRVYIRFASDDR